MNLCRVTLWLIKVQSPSASKQENRFDIKYMLMLPCVVRLFLIKRLQNVISKFVRSKDYSYITNRLHSATCYKYYNH